MIIPSEDKEEKTRPQLSEPRLILKDLTPTAVATQSASVAAEEEDIEVPTKELEKYIFSTSTDLASSSISKHLEAMHE